MQSEEKREGDYGPEEGQLTQQEMEEVEAGVGRQMAALRQRDTERLNYHSKGWHGYPHSSLAAQRFIQLSGQQILSYLAERASWNLVDLYDAGTWYSHLFCSPAFTQHQSLPVALEYFNAGLDLYLVLHYIELTELACPDPRYSITLGKNLTTFATTLMGRPDVTGADFPMSILSPLELPKSYATKEGALSTLIIKVPAVMQTAFLIVIIMGWWSAIPKGLLKKSPPTRSEAPDAKARDLKRWDISWTRGACDLP